MKKQIKFIPFIATFVFGFIFPLQALGASVEIRLTADLDDSRGYCLDVAGGQGTSAPIERGLQAHTCYDYTGSILEDQAFDSTLLSNAQLKIPYFDVCMTASTTQVDASLMLEPCEGIETQAFMLEESGRLVLKSEPDLCVTVSSTEKKEGRGGSPVHVMRPVSLQLCSVENKDYQTWKTYSL